MCGLVGIIGDVYGDDLRMFDTMLKLDTLRGPHSTGMARAPQDQKKRHEVKIVKETGTPWDLINKRFQDYVGGNGNKMMGIYSFIMGHNRWATVGEIKPENAHPFRRGKIVGAQNGTVPEYALQRLGQDYKQFETDTEAVINSFDQIGIKETVNKLTGAWAFTVYNAETDTFHILRNKERPLYYAWSENKRKLYYASESDFLYHAADKANIKFADKHTVYSFPVDTLHSFKLGNVNQFSPANLTTEEVKGWEYKATSYSTVTHPFPKVTPTNTGGGDKKVSPTAYLQQNGNKRVDFFLTGQRVTEGGKEYVVGRTKYAAAEIRIYNPSGDVDALLRDPEVTMYSGEIKKVRSIEKDGVVKSWGVVHGASIVAANKITYIRPEPKKEEEVAHGFMGEELDFEKFKKATNRGCAWCGGGVLYDQHKGLRWIARDEFLCEDCDNGECRQFLEFMCK